MIIWGSTVREIVQDSGQFHCPQCGSQQECQVVRIATYFTLYFIPIFETTYHGDGIKCLSCKLLFTPNVLNDTPASSRRKKKRMRNRRRQEHEDDYGV